MFESQLNLEMEKRVIQNSRNKYVIRVRGKRIKLFQNVFLVGTSIS